jgi:4-hydroxy-4-methyl-2-oxoglutarate aldolase
LSRGGAEVRADGSGGYNARFVDFDETFLTVSLGTFRTPPMTAPTTALSAETLAKLVRFDTPTICNVIELFDVRPRNVGYMDHRVKCNFPEFPPIVGYAATACFRSDAPPAGGDAYGSIGAQLEQFARLPGPSIVVFQDLDDPPAAAVFGEVMCSTYQAFGSPGLITNGAGRDLEQVRALKYPVFTGSTICSHGYCHMLHLGLPVRVGSLMVNNGDLLHADANGVTNIPVDIAAEVADVSAEFLAAEEIVLSYVKSMGEKSITRYNDLRKEFQNIVNGLTKRVSRKKTA